MFQFIIPIITKAEQIASDGGSVEEVLEKLRELSLDDFGMFLIGLPDNSYPALSKLLPPMASKEVQESWTGASGHELFRQTSSFIRQLENNYVRYAGRPLRGARIMEFGCGYGNLFRMLYYYADPAQLWGIHTWPASLALCEQDRVLGNFALTAFEPDELPVEGARFDLIFSYSMFTHLAPRAVDVCLAAIRKVLDEDGLFVCTVRPVEFWPYLDKLRQTKHAEQMYKDHLIKGFAYLPHVGEEGVSYGDASIALEYFDRPGWDTVAYDWSMLDPYHVTVILRPA